VLATPGPHELIAITTRDATGPLRDTVRALPGPPLVIGTAGAAGALDPSQPVTSFLFCACGGSLHFYQTAGCPTTVICGAAGGLVVANGVSHLPPAATYFSIPAPGLVRVVYQTSAQSQAQAKAQTQAVDVEVAFNRAAGTNQ